MEKNQNRGFYAQAARAGWVLPIAALAVMILAQRAITRPEGMASFFIVSGVLLALLLGGAVFGLLGFLGGKEAGKRPWAGLAGALISLAMLGLITYVSAESYEAKMRQQMEVARAENLKAMVLQANQMLPMMVDEGTRADKLEMLGPDLLGYNYTFVGEEKESFDAEGFSKEIFPQLLSNYLTNPKFKSFRESGISIRYSYFDKNGEPLARVLVPEPLP